MSPFARSFDSSIQETAAYRVRAYQADAGQRLSIPYLLRLCQETALRNIDRIGFAFKDLSPLGLSWVLLRQYVEVERLPELGEELFVSTCASRFERVFTYRDFRVYTADGELLARATSTWMLLDLESRRFAPIPDFIKVIERDFPAQEEVLPPRTGKLSPWSSDDESAAALPFRVGYHHLDWNDHLTNTFYPEWMLEALPPDLLRGGRLRSLDISFSGEARLGDRLEVFAAPRPQKSGDEPLGSASAYRHAVRREGQTLARMDTEWR